MPGQEHVRGVRRENHHEKVEKPPPDAAHPPRNLHPPPYRPPQRRLRRRPLQRRLHTRHGHGIHPRWHPHRHRRRHRQELPHPGPPPRPRALRAPRDPRGAAVPPRAGHRAPRHQNRQRPHPRDHPAIRLRPRRLRPLELRPEAGLAVFRRRVPGILLAGARARRRIRRVRRRLGDGGAVPLHADAVVPLRGAVAGRAGGEYLLGHRVGGGAATEAAVCDAGWDRFDEADAAAG
mmetsp:Transcript_25361/g.63411  ORF Transcript_25361/g.63411 Transcript_25361/m.63411 type:complete len:234 (-) Transcript_25361:426-1127(-)